MAHIHSIYDTDKHFSIDPITRAITNQSDSKTVIMQNDHNSERFTFEIPRYFEEHDMSLCNKVQVHYINIGDSSRRSKGAYEVTDMQLSPEDENIIICSWLISGNATALAGSLTFALRFACMTGDVVDYAWHTGPHSGIVVGASINNSEEIATQYVDILQSWYNEFLGAGNNGVSKIEEATAQALINFKAAASDEVNHIISTLEKEIKDETEKAVETIQTQADEIVNLVLDRLPIAEEASF